METAIRAARPRQDSHEPVASITSPRPTGLTLREAIDGAVLAARIASDLVVVLLASS
jgi:hypothetical protein